MLMNIVDKKVVAGDESSLTSWIFPSLNLVFEFPG